MAKIVLYHPEIAGNVGSIIRTIACLGGELHIIEPCGFAFDEQKIRRAAMDYFDKIKIYRHDSFADFYQNEVASGKSRLILATTKAEQSYHEFKFLKDDFLLFGRESAGVTEEIVSRADGKIKIMMENDARSLNLAVSAAIILAHVRNSV